ncbi:hypothetical protein [Brevundimonas sp.]|uniref:hypothetical protein n=1 Tax=Brevundimonas sp. TaxID=1871086 RepID=UPI002FC9ED47
MLKLIGVILVLAIGFGGGWTLRSYRNADACREAGGSIDTNRGICTGVGGTAGAPPLTAPSA